MKTIFYFPQKKIVKLFSNNKNIFFFDNQGLYKIQKRERINIKIDTTLGYKILQDKNFNEIIKDISDWGPVWSRFVDRGDQYELYKRQILIKSLHLINFIKKNNIKLIIMYTYISHNIQSLMFDLICKHSNTKQIFFFHANQLPGNKENLLVPILQKNNFKNRKFLNIKLSNYSFREFLLEKKKYIENKANEKISSFKTYYQEYFYSRSFILSLAKSIMYYSYANIRKFIIKSYNVNFYYMDIMNYSVTTHIKQMAQQQKSISFYRKNTKTFNSFNSKYLMIASHTQPEAASYPQGQEWNNHIDMILELRKKGYNDKILYKEHATNFNYYDHGIQHGRKGSNRSEEYYKNILSLNSIFLPENFNIFHTSSLENILPVTISGSIAIERSIAGYKTIYFGYPWWAGLPGTIHISEIKNLSNIKKYILYDKQISVSAINYLCKMLDNKTIVNSVNMHAINNDINADNKHFANKIKEIIKKVT